MIARLVASWQAYQTRRQATVTADRELAEAIAQLDLKVTADLARLRERST